MEKNTRDRWFKVSDLTSLTLQVKNVRHRSAAGRYDVLESVLHGLLSGWHMATDENKILLEQKQKGSTADDKDENETPLFTVTDAGISKVCYIYHLQFNLHLDTQ